MGTLKPDDFEAFFGALHRDAADQPLTPFPWQSRLARQVCEGDWPDCIALPTASGKTACIDIAVFALAVQAERPTEQRSVGRRIFFVVNRPVIVDEAHDRARNIACKLAGALKEKQPNSTLYRVAAALKRISGDDDAPPLDVAMLRGGIVRDNRWARSITQPVVVTSTVDQVGSRLLFRGYGVSPGLRPIHAALVAHDSTILLDEAHISEPFVQTLDAVRRYRGDAWAEQSINTPFIVVPMTATPKRNYLDVFKLNDDDRDRHKNPILPERLCAPKPVTLHVAEKAKGKRGTAALAEELADRARALVGEGRRTVAVIVNRVATARAVYGLLRPAVADVGKPDVPEVHMAIGRMRPIDRDALTRRLQERVGGAVTSHTEAPPLFTVATQCLEVGADFDFDTIVSECASLDALRQRFGRLNRRGREINARGCIVIRQDQIQAEEELEALDAGNELADPIYGNALARTWNALQIVAVDGEVEFGIEAQPHLFQHIPLPPLLAPTPDAPVMMPAHVDALAQTNPAPWPELDVSLFLHGPGRGEPDVQVCWRHDLPAEPPRDDAWARIVSLCPPSSLECMTVPIGIVRAWMAEQNPDDELRGDVSHAAAPSDERRSPDAPPSTGRCALAWRGLSSSELVRKPYDINPGDTLVLPVTAGGWNVFGYLPGAPDDPADVDHRLATAIDVAEQAYRHSRGRAIIRLTPARMADWPASEAKAALELWLSDSQRQYYVDEIRSRLADMAVALAEHDPATAATLDLLSTRKAGLSIEHYPDAPGVVLTTRRAVPLGPNEPWRSMLPAMDEGEDELSRSDEDRPVSLADHTADVLAAVDRTLPLLPVTPWAAVLRNAARLHDWGKVDARFQALLINDNLTVAEAQPKLWAKSANLPMTLAQRRLAHDRSGLPRGFRHEMLSMQLAERTTDPGADDPADRGLMLHLIASHHGHARPFAPVVEDASPPDVSLDRLGEKIALTSEQRSACPPHRLDSGVAERYWSLTRRFGWWGLVYLEAVLRLADQRASADARPHAADDTASSPAEPVEASA